MPSPSDTRWKRALDSVLRLARLDRPVPASDPSELLFLRRLTSTLVQDLPVDSRCALDVRILQARSRDKAGREFAQNHLRILSGLYGVLRPLDVIQPYRLEMGVRLKTRRGHSLYDFWGDRIAKQLNADAAEMADPTLVNLASQEYFGAVDRKALKIPVLTCQFKEERDGQVRILSFFAKKARGLMARYVIDNRIDRAEGLKTFNVDGYRFSKALSSDAEWVFTRPQP